MLKQIFYDVHYSRQLFARRNMCTMRRSMSGIYRCIDNVFIKSADIAIFFKLYHSFGKIALIANFSEYEEVNNGTGTHHC